MDNNELNIETISPIVFDPLQYYAEIETEDGKTKMIPVYHQKLAGVYLPKTIDNPQELLRSWEKKLFLKDMCYSSTVECESLTPTSDVPVVTQKETQLNIIRATVPKAASLGEIANFHIFPRIRYVYVNRKGEQEREKEIIFGKIIFDHVQEEPFCIHTKDISNVCKTIKKKYAIARINYETKNVEKMIEDEFRLAIAECQVIYRFYQQGWQIINQDMIYVNKSARHFDNVEYALDANLPLVKCDREDIGKYLHIAFDLYHDRASMGTMMMFSFLGVLYRLFKEAGFPPKFLLFLHGKTGSLKTTIAKILYTQLSDDKVRDTPRRIDSDTIVSFERAVIESGYDTVTLIDDYNPAKSRRKKEEMASKLESIIRLVGDASSKSRSNIKLEDCRGEGVQGTVVLTGELRGKGLSSNLRCLYCKMSRDKANIDIITWFQENPAVFTTIINEFAEYVGANWQSIVTYIRNNFSSMRREIGVMLSERRLVDSVVTLHLVYHIMLHFLLDYCRVEKSEVMKVVGNVPQDIINNALMSQTISSEDSPSILFIKTVNDLMRIGTIVLGTGKMELHDIDKFDGFDDVNYLYFNPESIFKKVRSFYLASNIDFSMDLKEMIVALYDDGIIKTASNGKGKQTYCVRIGVGDGKKQNFLKISKEVFRKVLDDSMDIVW